MPTLILDVMGGDKAPHANLEGAIQAFPELVGELVLLGDEKVIRPLLSRRRFRLLKEALGPSARASRCKVSFIHADQNIEMDDSIRALRRKPGATINIGCQLAAKAYQDRAKGAGPAAFVSAGHSGAMMASALLNMGRLPGIERPAIAVKLPTLSPDGCVVLDVGANVDCKPEHLRDFAIMGAMYGQVERSTPGLPRVGILSNGEEKSKGNTLTRAAAALVEEIEFLRPEHAHPIGQYVGNVEGKEIFKGQVDVVVTDGFVGNVMLKAVEGLGSAVITLVKQEAKHSLLAPLGFLLAAGILRRLKRRLDYAEYGAAPLLGVAGYVFICHGRSNPRAIRNALLRAQTALKSAYVERLEGALTEASHLSPKPT